MNRKKKSTWCKSERARHAERMERLSTPITPQDIATFVRHLVAVSFGANSECWLYASFNRGKGLPEDLAVRTDRYANFKFHGETVGAHQFALCAARGITLAELAGYDVHHVAKRRCIGYRCCNPDHLDKVPRKLHRGTQGGKDTLVRYHTKLVSDVLKVPQNRRRPVEYQIEPRANPRARSLGDVPFMIRGGVMDGVLDASSAELPEPGPA
jgi:hypothetical protein